MGGEEEGRGGEGDEEGRRRWEGELDKGKEGSQILSCLPPPPRVPTARPSVRDMCSIPAQAWWSMFMAVALWPTPHGLMR